MQATTTTSNGVCRFSFSTNDGAAADNVLTADEQKLIVKTTRDFDWVTAETEFRHAIALSPGNADTYSLYGRMCAMLGRLDEAVEMVRRAYDLDPLAHRSDIATTLIRAGRFEEARTAALTGPGSELLS